MRHRVIAPIFAGLLPLICGCVSHEVRTVDMTPPQRFEQALPETQLLDVGVTVFDANVPESYDERIEQLIQPDIRRAEANYMPYFAKNLLQSTGNWGAVRVVPRATHAVDVVVTGKILHSDGESMEVEIRVEDATGKEWFTRRYEALASKYAYDDSVPANIDPFQSVYKQLADDMLAYRRELSAEQVQTIRATAKMKFAQDFAPDAFADHIAESKNGEFQLKRLPAPDDPMLKRVERVREREYLFIDTLDEYFENYHRSMYGSYHDWREATYEEAIAYKLLRDEARRRTLGGAVAIVGGVAAMAESSDSAVDTGGLVSIIGGAMTLKSAIAKRQEAEMHAEALREVGVAAEAEVMPHTIELENQVVRLEGTVDQQYDKLRGILRDLYFADLDLPAADTAASADVNAADTQADAEQLEQAIDTTLTQ
ncbi:MAG: hypothetical protein RIC56_22050 [Pseudomonadales bacterium]